MSLSTFHKRMLLFWIGCIGTRSAAVWLAYSHPTLLPYMGTLAAIIAVGFFSIYIGNLRQTGLEVFGDRIWWNHLRPIHAILYAAFAYFALTGRKRAWVFLALDVILGAAAWLHFHLG